MNRVAAIVVTLAVVAGSVPAAAALGTGAQTGTAASGAEPGATFAGVIGVQEAEVDSEVAERALDQQFAAAESNGSKARVVAEQQEQLDQRLRQLEAEKARLDRAYENGSIGQGQYQARLAGLAAEIRALERQANRTATVAESLPEAALREQGANASRVRSIAQQANRTGGGEVAEAARKVAGESVGNGLGPPNGSERGPPDGANGDGKEAGNGQRPNGTGPDEGQGPGQAPSGNATSQPNASDRPAGNGVGTGGNDAGSGAANGTAGGSNGAGDGQNTATGRNTTGTGTDTEPGGEPRNAGNGTADVTNRTDGNATGQTPRNGSVPGGNSTDGDTTNGNGADGNGADDTGTGEQPGDGTPTPAATRTA